MLEPDFPRKLLLNGELGDEEALERLHVVKGQWFSDILPVKVVGCGLPIQFWYVNMRRLGKGLQPGPDKSIPGMILSGIMETVRVTVQRIWQSLRWAPVKIEKIE